MSESTSLNYGWSTCGKWLVVVESAGTRADEVKDKMGVRRAKEAVRQAVKGGGGGGNCKLVWTVDAVGNCSLWRYTGYFVCFVL